MESVKLKYRKDGPATEVESAYKVERPEKIHIFN